MASQSILRTVKSPARVLVKPSSARSILKRPAPLPLSPNPFPSAATFSVVISSAKLSPHVHFPPSPAMAATFSAYSPNTYDRGPIIVSPSSLDIPTWGARINSPSVKVFKLADPPKRTAGAAKTSRVERNLTVPLYEDPRSPKPYQTQGSIRFAELSANVLRPQEELSKALTSYPRSPYPSAPITPTEEKEDVAEEMESRGRTTHRWPNRGSRSDKSSPLPTRARSLEVKAKRRQTIGPHVSSPSAQHFLSPVQESPRVVITKPMPLNLGPESASPGKDSTRLSQAFWQSVSLHEEDSNMPSSTQLSAQGPYGLASPAPQLLFGSRDGSSWSPGLPKKRPTAMAAEMQVPSPAQRTAFSKSMVASPSPNDPFAAFPSFTIALMSGRDGAIAYPPRALVEQD